MIEAEDFETGSGKSNVSFKNREDGMPGTLKSSLFSKPVYEESLAQTFSLLATLLNQIPDVALVEKLRIAGGDCLKLTGENLEAPVGIEQGLQKMSDFIEATADLPGEEVQEQLAIDWTRLFRGVSPTYGPQPPYEGLFRPDLGDHIVVMQAVNRIYREIGVATSDENSNRPDYLGTELGFLSFLIQQMAKAGRAGESSDARHYAGVAEKFMKEHLSKWVAAFISEAYPHANTDFYKGVLLLIESVCRP